MADQNRVSRVAAAMVGDDFVRREAPLLPALDARLIAAPAQFRSELVDAEGKNAEQAAEHVNFRNGRGLIFRRCEACGRMAE